MVSAALKRLRHPKALLDFEPGPTFRAFRKVGFHGPPLGVCGATVLSPRWGSAVSFLLPTACAVGCILTPLRGSCQEFHPIFLAGAEEIALHERICLACGVSEFVAFPLGL